MTSDPTPINLRDHPGRPLDRALRVAIAGGGARGMTYATLLDESDGQAVVGAIAEPREAIRTAMGVRFAIPEGDHPAEPGVISRCRPSRLPVAGMPDDICTRLEGLGYQRRHLRHVLHERGGGPDGRINIPASACFADAALKLDDVGLTVQRVDLPPSPAGPPRA